MENGWWWVVVHINRRDSSAVQRLSLNLNWTEPKLGLVNMIIDIIMKIITSRSEIQVIVFLAASMQLM